MDHNPFFEKFIKYFVSGACFTVFLCLTIRAFFVLPGADFIENNAHSVEKLLICGLSAGFFFLFSSFVKRVLSYIPERIINIVPVLSGLIAFVVQMYFLFVIRNYYKWDTGFVLGAAASLADKGSVCDEAYYYMSVYPNQNGFVLFTALLYKLSSVLGIGAASRPLFYNFVLTLFTDIGVLFMLPTFERMLGKRLTPYERARYFILILLNPFWYIGASYYYTVTLSLPLMTILIYLMPGKIPDPDPEADSSGGRTAEGGQTDGSYLRMAFIGALAAVSYVIRPTVIIPVIAFVIIMLFIKKPADTPSDEKYYVFFKGIFVKVFSFTISFVLITILFTGISGKIVGIDTKDTAFPATHWIMMSLTPPGGHNAEDEEFTASFETADEKKEAVNERLKEKLEELGVKGLFDIWRIKTIRTFGDGEYGYLTYLADGYGTGTVYEYIFGSHRDISVIYHQGYYLFIQIFMLFSCLYVITDTRKTASGKAAANKAAGNKTFLLVLTMLGAVMFYCLWEASEQYSVPFMSIWMLLGLSGIKWMDEVIWGFGIKEATEKTEENKKTGKQGAAERAVRIGGIFITIAAVALGIYRYRMYTCSDTAFTYACADQILANRELKLRPGEELVQHFKINTPFNRMIFQWRNFVGEENKGVYSVELKRGEDTILSDSIKAAESPLTGSKAYSVGIPSIASGIGLLYGENDYELHIKQIEGDEDNCLSFVVYDMYGFRPYPGGELTYLKDGKPSEEDSKDMSLTFAFDLNDAKPYISEGAYCVFLLIIFALGMTMSCLPESRRL